MLINGFSFCGFNAASNTPISVESINDVTIENAIFDAMDTSDITSGNMRDSFPDEWDVDTIMHADFRENAAAGNVDYAIYEASGLRVKRRKAGSREWITIKEIPIEKPEDFSFVLYDMLAKAETTYEYSIVPVINSIEGAIVAKTIDSAFDGVLIFDGDKSYHAIMDIALESSRVKTSAVVTTLGSRYPYVVSNSQANFCEGTLRAFFLPSDGGCPGYTTVGVTEFRRDLNDFLTNGNAKILKDYTGRMWLVMTTNGVAEIEEGHPQHVLSSFTWTEIGDAEDQRDLYSNGFTEVAGG